MRACREEAPDGTGLSARRAYMEAAAAMGRGGAQGVGDLKGIDRN